jgi:hypothetical protein
MDRALAEAVIPKRFDGERPERRPFLRKHHRDLALRRAVDARIGPVPLPAIQVRLRGVDGLEAQPLQRRLLCVTDAGFDFAFGESRQMLLMARLRSEVSGSPIHSTH